MTGETPGRTCRKETQWSNSAGEHELLRNIMFPEPLSRTVARGMIPVAALATLAIWLGWR
jgi:hypothetical protein